MAVNGHKKVEKEGSRGISGSFQRKDEGRRDGAPLKGCRGSWLHGILHIAHALAFINFKLFLSHLSP